MRLVWVFLLFPFLALSQNITVSPLDTIFQLKNKDFIGVDTHVYFVDGAILHKKNHKEDLQFSDIQLGEITSVDILNPLRITVFYKEFNTAIILDNTLSEITRIDFNRLENYRNISHARTAADRKLWIFNIDLQQLELFDYRLNKVVQTFSPQGKNAIEMASDFNNCWILTEDELLHYNRYGSLLSREKISDVQDLQVVDENMFAIKDNNLVVRVKNQKSWRIIKDNVQGLKQFYLNGGNLYLYSLDFVSFNRIILPKN